MNKIKELFTPASLLLFFGFFSSSAGVLWFMLHALDRERAVVQAELERALVQKTQALLLDWNNSWNSKFLTLDMHSYRLDSRHVFHRAISKFYVDTAFIKQGQKGESYPTEIGYKPSVVISRPEWVAARNLEFIDKNFSSAIASYQKLLSLELNEEEGQSVRTAIARSYEKQGEIRKAIEIYKTTFQTNLEHESIEIQGDASVSANAALRVVELLHQEGEQNEALVFAKRLAKSLVHTYFLPISSRQRISLMTKLRSMEKELSSKFDFELLYDAEILANEIMVQASANTVMADPYALESSGFISEDYFAAVSDSKRVILIFSRDALLQSLNSVFFPTLDSGSYQIVIRSPSDSGGSFIVNHVFT